MKGQKKWINQFLAEAQPYNSKYNDNKYENLIDDKFWV